MNGEQQRAACLRRFMDAVRDGRAGDYVKAQTIVHRIRQASGDTAAEAARRELFNFIRSDKSHAITAEADSEESPETAPRTVKRAGRTVRIR